jgi:hypothetical protein
MRVLRQLALRSTVVILIVNGPKDIKDTTHIKNTTSIRAMTSMPVIAWKCSVTSSGGR